MLNFIAMFILFFTQPAEATVGVCKSMGEDVKTSANSYVIIGETSMCGYAQDANSETANIILPTVSGAHCGACVHVAGPTGNAIFRVTEMCEEAVCGTSDKINLSRKAFLRVTGREGGRATLRWKFTPCPETLSKMQYRVTNHSMPFFVSFQILGTRYPVSRVEVKTATGYVKASYSMSKSFTAVGRIVEPVQFKMVDMNGSEITDILPNPRLSRELQDARVRFPTCIPK
jgi:expansin (peptidoglycan-binding protein)